MPKTTIELSSPIAAPQGAIKAITLREPAYRDFIDLGFPVTWVSTGGGGFEQETPGLIGSWIERLCDMDPNLLSLLGLRDTLKLRDAVLAFFREARTEEESTKSSGSADGSSSQFGFDARAVNHLTLSELQHWTSQAVKFLDEMKQK